MSEETITIFGQEIHVTHEEIPIDDLMYFEENPRVFSCIYGESAPKGGDKLQEFIQKKMWEQPSVKNLLPSIKGHGGLLEPILIRYDTKQVIEGNSRLAAFRRLYKDTKDEKWATIACNCVDKLTEEQQDAYLNQIHIKGKTAWSAYEKANFAYVRADKGVPIEDIAHRSSETENEINKRIQIIKLMKKNGDQDKSHFSYYDVLLRTRTINNSNNYTSEVKEFLLSTVKDLGVKGSDYADFKAQDLRSKMPSILEKKKILKKFVKGELTLDEAYQDARPSDPQKKVRMAKDKIMDIAKIDVSCLEIFSINELLANVSKLIKEVKRMQLMVQEVKNQKGKK